MKKRSVTKLLSYVLAFSMVVTAAPVTAWAKEAPAAEEQAAGSEGIGEEDAGSKPEGIKEEGAGSESEGVVEEAAGSESEGAGEELAEVQKDAAEDVPEAAEGTDEVAAPEPEEITSRKVAVDGKADAWFQDPATVIGEDAQLDNSGKFLYLKAGSGNGNSNSDPAQYPAVFVHPNKFDFTKEGYFEFQAWPMGSAEYNRFGLYMDYQNPNYGMFLGFDKGGWFWQRYGADGDWYKGGRTPALAPGQWTPVRVDWTADGKFSLTVDGVKVFSEEPSGLTHGAEGQIGIKCSGFNANETTEVYMKDIYYTGQAETADGYHITGKVVDEEGNPVEGAQVTIGRNKAETGADGAYDVEVLDGTYTVKVSKTGYSSASAEVKVEGGNVQAEDIILISKTITARETLQTEAMSVQVARNFPSIIQYDMKQGSLKDKTFYGQTERINTIKINGAAIAVEPEDVKATFTDTKATYVMSLKGENVDCVITAVISVKDNTAAFDITKVQNNLKNLDENGYAVYPVQTIEIPNHSLISVNSGQESAHLKGAKMSSNTRLSGDKDFDVVKGMKLSGNKDSEDFIYGFINNNEMSAGLWSNSENQGTHVAANISAGGASNTRVIATASAMDNGETSLGLASAMWYYDRKVRSDVVTSSDDKGNSKTEKRTYVVGHEIMPSAKVVITGDENEDNGIDWQDGAVAFRSIMHNPFKCEEVPNLVNYRIAMNFGSQAANPFLSNLDSVKRVYLNTEGLGQGVLLKGYGSEGHDSGHPDYGDIGWRIGGADDMNKLMVEGKKMGALFGIHVNASEMYAEAKAFSDELSRGYAGIDSGWTWLDQGVGINSRYDLATGARESRFQELYKKVGNNLDFIYVDVWGNGVSDSWTDGESSEDAWASRMLSREITGLGWRMATEWGPTQEYDSTLQHWAADLTYGGYSSKGENSEVMRFLRNHQKDSWIADYPGYGGAAQMPLLGGLNMTDFEGWQRRADYKNYITVMFRHNLITKYLQHYQIVDWVDGTPVTSEGSQWTPEMKITLKNTKDAADNTELVVERGSNDINDLANYRSRTITLNGVVISQGAPTSGDSGSIRGNEKYLIPWNWDCNGGKLDADDQKLYHWNTTGGESTWELTGDWAGLENVVLYKLTDEGKKDKKVVAVVDNHITLEGIEAEIPYVIYKGEKAQLAVDWQTSEYVYDMGFNDTVVDSHRTVSGEGTAEIVDNAGANNMLKLEGEVSVSTTLTNLKAGQKYALYVGVDNRSNSKAHVTVKDGSKVLGTNYAVRSYAQNYVASNQHHTGDKGGPTVPGTDTSYFQNMFVFFTAEGTTATLSFDRDAGDGATYFDDIRVVETKMDAIVDTDKDGIATALFNDFENNAQGIWPFVISSTEWVEDNRIHLSERHDIYTQAGYMNKAVDDVLDGNWSVKVNGLSQRNNLIYQTIPQNFHFKPGETYNVSFDYQMGGDGVYEVRLGDGQNQNVQSWKLAGAIGKTKRCSFTFTVGDSEDYWVGIYSTSTPSQTGGFSSKRLGFAGYQDFILDNLRIEQGNMTIDKTYVEAETAKDPISLNVSFTGGVSPSTKVTWTTSDKNVARVTDDGDVYFVGFGSAMITATARILGKETSVSCMVYLKEGTSQSATFTDVWANTHAGGAEPHPNGYAQAAVDGSGGTYWHCDWAGGISESNPAIITAKFTEDISDFNNVAFQQRGTGGQNGLVQKYECIVGKGFDSASHTITGTDGVDRFTTGVVDAAKTGNGQIETLNLPEGTKGNYIQIRVLQGHGGFAALAEILINTEISFDTPEERAFMKANNERFAWDDLAEAIAAAKDIYNAGEGLHSEESWTAFKEAYLAAVAGKDSTDTEELVSLREALVSAQEGLVELTEEGKKLEAAKKELQAAVKAAKADYEGGQKDYTNASWERFEDAYTAAQAGESSESLEEVKRLKTELVNSQKGLQEKSEAQKELEASQKALKDAIEAAKPLYDGGQGTYSNSTWDAFADAYTAAQAGVNSESSSKLNRLATALTTAQANLKEGEEGPGQDPDVVNAQNALKAAISLAKPVIDAGRKNYTEATWSEFEEAYDAAKAGESSVSLTRLNRLKKNLEAAQAGLKEKPGTSTDQEVKDAQNALKTAISQAKPLIDAGKKNYTDASYGAFEAAYDAAKAGETSTSVTTLKRLKADLEAAQAGLKEKPGTSTDQEVKDAQDALKTAISQAKPVIDAGKKNYTDASFEAFEEAYDAAKAGESSTSVTTLKRLKAELEAAQAGLEEEEQISEQQKKVEEARKKLNEAIAAAKPVYEKGMSPYTKLSWEKFESAYTGALIGRYSNSLTRLTRLTSTLTEKLKALEPKLKSGDKITVGNIEYKVISAAKKTVTVVRGTNKKATSVSINSSVRIKGENCKVVKIEPKAFYKFTKLKSVYISPNVTSIGDSSFYGCSKLTEVVIGKRVTTIGKKAFRGCKVLKDVTFRGKLVKKIGSQAFKSTSSKMKVTLPKSTTSKKRSSMTKMLQKAGMSKKATVK